MPVLDTGMTGEGAPPSQSSPIKGEEVLRFRVSGTEAHSSTPLGSCLRRNDGGGWSDGLGGDERDGRLCRRGQVWGSVV